ncbi:GDSL-like Lipase/Acylhydrolase [Roseimaritima multifibrata]|uniref:GDSL-like Lipase/Acylhydrolase n=1 Tax=Roseimaritima multifibrata TaxID=1930274 RepID=A0A517MJC0_9BACT|nr:SGNH/GDSL hydrolase family protein [Roseimaritima multifibrata]QDS94877.1 GDSL-like Lipase/Acylhydrolase [Roseimaritima multifibrata]
MNDRRNFLRSGLALASLANLTVFASAREPGATARSSAAEGYGYRLPAFKHGSRLLFQGDSITDMKWGRNQKDRNHYLGHSYVFLLAARLGVDMPEAELDFYNRGISGHKVGDLRDRWLADAIDMKPDLLSILIGVNDVGRNLDGVDVDKWETDYRFILNASRKANPELKLVLLDPFVLPSGRLAQEAMFKKWRDQVERLIPIVGRLAEEFDAVHVKTQDVFDAAAEKVSPEHWLWDGVHPLPQGHELIARNWLYEVSARWGTA